eukprot:2005242-Amphidinium_carterae.1
MIAGYVNITRSWWRGMSTWGSHTGPVVVPHIAKLFNNPPLYSASFQLSVSRHMASTPGNRSYVSMVTQDRRHNNDVDVALLQESFIMFGYNFGANDNAPGALVWYPDH